LEGGPKNNGLYFSGNLKQDRGSENFLKDFYFSLQFL